MGELAEFFVEAQNTSAEPLTNVRVSINPETTLRPTGATQGFDTSPGALVWRYASLAPGKTIQLTVNCDCVGEANLACNWATVTADGDVSQAARACLEILPGPDGAASRGEGETSVEAPRFPATAPPLPTTVREEQPIAPRSPPPESREAPPAAPRRAPPPIQSPPSTAPGNLTLSVTDDMDPIRVGGMVTYRLTLANRTAESDRQVLVRVNLPDQVSVEAIRGGQSTRFQDTLRFTPINELRAGETVTFEIRARAIRPGTASISADVTSLRQANATVANATTEILSAE